MPTVALCVCLRECCTAFKHVQLEHVTPKPWVSERFKYWAVFPNLLNANFLHKKLPHFYLKVVPDSSSEHSSPSPWELPVNTYKIWKIMIFSLKYIKVKINWNSEGHLGSDTRMIHGCQSYHWLSQEFRRVTPLKSPLALDWEGFPWHLREGNSCWLFDDHMSVLSKLRCYSKLLSFWRHS